MQVDIHKEVKKLAGFGGKALSKAMETEELLFYAEKRNVWIVFDFPASAFFAYGFLPVYIIDASKLGKGLTFEVFYPKFMKHRFSRQIAGLVNALYAWSQGYIDIDAYFNFWKNVLMANWEKLQVLTRWTPADSPEEFGFVYDYNEHAPMPWWKFLEIVNRIADGLEVGEEFIKDNEDWGTSVFIDEKIVEIAPLHPIIYKISPDHSFDFTDKVKSAVNKLGFKESLEILLMGTKWKKELESLLS